MAKQLSTKTTAKQLWVIKLGGQIFTNQKSIQTLMETIKGCEREFQSQFILVHGGGKQVDELLEKLGFVIEKQGGLRVTPPDQIPYIVGMLAGTLNKQLMAEAIKSQLSPIGLSLTDGNTCHVEQSSLSLGHVGLCQGKSPAFLSQLLEQGHTPIVSSIGIAHDGTLLNVNADHAATAISQCMNAELIYLSDISHVLDKQGNPINTLNEVEADAMIQQGVIRDGMKVKVEAAVQAAKTLKKTITVMSGFEPETIYQRIQGQPVGTQISA